MVGLLTGRSLKDGGGFVRSGSVRRHDGAAGEGDTRRQAEEAGV